MAILIDNLIHNQAEVEPGKWAIAKPVGKDPLPWRIKNAIAVLRGKATAVIFAEDILKEVEE